MNLCNLSSILRETELPSVQNDKPQTLGLMWWNWPQALEGNRGWRVAMVTRKALTSIRYFDLQFFYISPIVPS